MMGWWFPGRTLITILPLTALPLTLLVEKLPTQARVLPAALALTSVAFTIALRDAVANDGVRLAVTPFDMTWAPFRWSHELFPDYQTWGTETVVLTIAWLTIFVVSIVAVVWWSYGPELRSVSRRTAHQNTLTPKRI
jgi:hypothetical protein